MSEKGLVFVVAAPSGAGKTSLCHALLQRLREEGQCELFWSVSYTTRPAREGEVNGRDYFFVDDTTFDRMVENREFAEWAWVHNRRYGTSRAYLEESTRQGKDLLLEIDIQGARNLQSQYRQAVFIFILPPSWEALVQRLRRRGTESPEEVERRLDTAKNEMREWSWFDYIIVNDDFSAAVDRLRAVVLASRARRETMASTVQEILTTVQH